MTIALDRLARIEQEITLHRRLAREAEDAGHPGEVDWHQTEIDRLLGLWVHVRDMERAGVDFGDQMT